MYWWNSLYLLDGGARVVLMVLIASVDASAAVMTVLDNSSSDAVDVSCVPFITESVEVGIVSAVVLSCISVVLVDVVIVCCNVVSTGGVSLDVNASVSWTGFVVCISVVRGTSVVDAPVVSITLFVG